MSDDLVTKVKMALESDSTPRVFHIRSVDALALVSCIKSLTAERDRLRALVWAALDAWDIQDKDGGPMGDHWVSDARAALKGETP